MTRVFLAEETTRYNIDAAREFGEIVYLSDTTLNPFNTSKVARTFKERLKHFRFDPATDLICLTGNNLTVALLAASAQQLYGPAIRLLMFYSNNSCYRERVYDPTADKEDTCPNGA